MQFPLRDQRKEKQCFLKEKLLHSGYFLFLFNTKQFCIHHAISFVSLSVTFFFSKDQILTVYKKSVSSPKNRKIQAYSLYFANFSVKRNVLPSPSLLFTATVSPWAWMNSRTMESPRPAPVLSSFLVASAL